MTRTEAYLALNLLPQVGPVRVRKLLRHFGSPERILSAKSSEIVQVEGFGSAQAEAIAGWESQIDLAGELKKDPRTRAQPPHAGGRALSAPSA